MSYTIQCQIVAQEPPKVEHHCQACKKSAEFYCSEKFRVNAQQKHIDVWLIYKCVYCDSTWNLPVISRVRIGGIDKNLYQKFMNNDRETAWTYAFQIERLRKLCNSVNTNIKYTTVSKPIKLESGDVTIHLVSPYKFDLRLDKLLVQVLGISRSKLYQMVEGGRIRTKPQVSIKHKIKHDVEITIKGEASNITF
ncbi:hypothetical protein XYCOK13_19460 [Xylanibacillus composti]|uniref:DUF1062 domain-containing protein n=1 Tax=Xylanibacillus composti TaxID=1572762 RepID=A0A8J4H1B8_9BACL|nr:hypothetical protein XYCOK13_19460 [Xylanibacillus composti]